MQRSHCENENVRFVQELAEVDGPFESPININFRDLTKLELPSLVWNRSDSSPKKMKITNTGHTVIVSGKWKCERPYLTGGPLQGKYVFSQIHFHWGQDECRGSEHQVCGEGFPLEMHVAHFKTDYLTQESALREKDGMVIVVYLFKLQEERNNSLQKILNVLPSVKQAGTSQAVDPRPILSLCNPFTDDYFTYWGSVVTSTCAHILLWIVCREPFGISKDQVNEFRKILDTSQQPICKNNRDTQPLHRRNVFHVNASKNLDDPLLPIKKIVGCFCRGSEDNVSNESNTNSCSCKAYGKNQEDIEGSSAKRWTRSRCSAAEGERAEQWIADAPRNFFVHHSFVVREPAVHSVPLIPGRLAGDIIRRGTAAARDDPEPQLVSRSCCFFPTKEVTKIRPRPEKRKPRERKRAFNSLKLVSHIMNSLEALKNHTFKKLKEIESINREIKGIQTACDDAEDSRWLRRLEKMMTRQKKFTVRASQACFGELKKLARECNFDKLIDNKAISVGDNNHKIEWVKNGEEEDEEEEKREREGGTLFPCSEVCVKEEEDVREVERVSSKTVDIREIVKFSSTAQKLIQSFFEDIRESEELQETVKKNLQLKKLGSFASKQGGDAVRPRGYITQKMFTLGNLGDRFFAEVTPDDVEAGEDAGGVQGPVVEESRSDESFASTTSGVRVEDVTCQGRPSHEVIPLHKANAFGASRGRRAALVSENDFFRDEELGIPLVIQGNCPSEAEEPPSRKTRGKNRARRSRENSFREEMDLLPCGKFLDGEDAMDNFFPSSISFSSGLSTEIQRMVIGKVGRRHSKKNVSLVTRTSSQGLWEKTGYRKRRHKNGEEYRLKSKNAKAKERRKKILRVTTSSTSIEKETKTKKAMSKFKSQMEIEKSSDSILESTAEQSPISPVRKKLKLEVKKTKRKILRQAVRDDGHAVSLTESDAADPRHPTPRPKRHPLGSGMKGEGEATPRGAPQRALVRIHIPRNSPKESPGEGSGTSRSRVFRASSVESITTYLERKEKEKPVDFDSPPRTAAEVFKRNIKEPSSPRLFPKNRSLTNLIVKPRFQSAVANQRVFVENIDHRRKMARDAFEPRKQAEGPKRNEETPGAATKDISRKCSNETYLKSDGEGEEARGGSSGAEDPLPETLDASEYKVIFFTTSGHAEEESLTLTQLQGKPPQEATPPPHEPAEELPDILRPSDSDASFPKDSPDVKGNADVLGMDAADLPTSASCPLKKNPQSRAHSAESLHASIKVPKRKRKKRPHCCKRSSRHYIRKNSSHFKKLNKEETKASSFLGLPDEEQLQIISANLAKYLKQKLVEHNDKFDLGKSCSLKDLEDVVLNNLIDLELNSRENSKEEGEAVEGKPTLEEAPKETRADVEEDATAESCSQATERPEEQAAEKFSRDERPKTEKGTKPKEKPKSLERPRTSEIPKARARKEAKPPKERPKEPDAPASPRPAHNFIKLNKQMVGKYQRQGPPAERKENQLNKKKVGNQQQPKPETPKSKKKVASPKKKENRPSEERLRPSSPTSSPANRTDGPRSPTRANCLPVPKKATSKSDKTRPGSAPPTTETPEKSENDSSASLALQKIPQQKKRLMPAYMLTSYLPAPVAIVENQQMKMSRYNSTDADDYLPDVLTETKARNRSLEGADAETLFKKDLEYLIKLQMCLNNEISASLENSMNYVKSLMAQDHGGRTASDSLDLYDASSNGIVLIEVNDLLDGSASDSELPEDAFRSLSRNLASRHRLRGKDVSKTKIPQESGDSGVVNPAFLLDLEGQEGYASDSSYNCEISITLNAGSNDGEGEVQVYDPAGRSGELAGPLRSGSAFSQTTTLLERRSSTRSISFTQQRRKRKERNDISGEMKQKLLEILEGEIRREMTLIYGPSSENSSEGLALPWEGSEGARGSPSTESNCDGEEGGGPEERGGKATDAS